MIPHIKAQWTARLNNEPSAPENRIIHSRIFPCVSRLRRIGFKRGKSYFRCGSEMVEDWIIEARLLIRHGDQWDVLNEWVDLQDPVDDIIWMDVSIDETKDCILELRRSYTDGWWPSWNLATTGVEFDCDQTLFIRNAIPQKPLFLENNIEYAIEGIDVSEGDDEVVFSSAWLKVAFSKREPEMNFLSIDSQGNGNTEDNLLRHPDGVMHFSGYPHWAKNGVDVMELGHSQLRTTCTKSIHISDSKVSWKTDIGIYEWTIEPKRLQLKVHQERSRAGMAWRYSNWRFSFDSRKAPTALLGEVSNGEGEVGLMNPPAWIHSPGYGSLYVSTEGDWSLRFDSVRAFNLTAVELKLGVRADPSGCYCIDEGICQGTVTFEVDTPKLASLHDNAPRVVSDMIEQRSITALTYRADVASFSNNANSQQAQLCMGHWGHLVGALNRRVPGLNTSHMLQMTIERWLTDGTSYSAGKTVDENRMEHAYLMASTGPLEALGEFLGLSPKENEEWLEQWLPSIARKFEDVQSLDIDGDGLIESSIRTGVSGSNQWSTNWWDVISYGWKDAFVNAQLFKALKSLSILFLCDFTNLGTDYWGERLDAWAEQLKTNFHSQFWNEDTGWLAGWRCKNGYLHDYAFLYVNGLAASSGMYTPKEAMPQMLRLWKLLKEQPISSWRYGLPGNLIAIPESDQGKLQVPMDFGVYENGSLTHSQANHFIDGLYYVGLKEEGDELLQGLSESMADGSAFGGCGSGFDWRSWDGKPCGYEGLLTEQFGIISTAIKRYQIPKENLWKSTYNP